MDDCSEPELADCHLHFLGDCERSMVLLWELDYIVQVAYVHEPEVKAVIHCSDGEEEGGEVLHPRQELENHHFVHDMDLL